ncbi:ribosome small subunit-dependent GTPase A [Nocardia yunnanensis]|uniref:Small ribosomal subunit biogenesis GTPase RsgA n=1 Tax=Nocardia yunnanensis TaxID=2382165 RepID=A0A386ZHC1_9NOCA|nr:ribosome small subunit-dependent GTPase A [Nocardia yunnanensis]AYF76524.1 ribosome small subunit-dependent GTPase A [Nocardia yunnanensis]
MSSVDFDLLVPFGWNSSYADDYLPLLGADLIPARVIRMDRSECDVAAPLPTADFQSRLTAAVVRAQLPRSDSEISGLCTGDWVAIDRSRTVRALLPRRTAIVRAAVSGQPDTRATSAHQVLAANVDTVLVCAAGDGDVDLGRIERLLALAWDSGAQPVVALTKADLAQDIPLDAVRAAAPGVTVLAVSASTGVGMDVLTSLLDGTVALIGASGAGKSTLANALLGAEVFATDVVRAGDKRGRHTTVHRELRPLPGGGTLIDTPGLRSVGLWDAAEGLGRTFSDVESLSAHCRFTDCAHETEPGCAVRAAIESGDLPRRRLDSYRKLSRENDWLAARTDARARAERTKVWKQINKEQRRMYKERGNRG